MKIHIQKMLSTRTKITTVLLLTILNSVVQFNDFRFQNILRVIKKKNLFLLPKSQKIQVPHNECKTRKNLDNWTLKITSIRILTILPISWFSRSVDTLIIKELSSWFGHLTPKDMNKIRYDLPMLLKLILLYNFTSCHPLPLL